MVTKSADIRRVRAGRACVAGAVAASWLLLNLSAASAYSEKVNQSCNDDYLSYCSQHSLGSSALRYCFESNRGNLSQRCISALVDAGEVPRKYLSDRRK